MEKTFEKLNNNNILNPIKPSMDHTIKDAVKKAHENFSTLSAMKDSCTFKSPT